MKYGDAIGRAFKSLKSGGLWTFAITALGSIVAVYAVVVGAAFLVAGPSRVEQVFRLLSSPGSQPAASDFIPLIMLYAAVGIAGIIAIPLFLIFHGGMVHLSDEVIAGRGAKAVDGWAIGFRRMGRVFVIDLVVGLLAFAGILVVLVPLIIGLVASSGGSSGAAVVGVCGGFMVYFFGIIAIGLFLSGFEALSIRYGIIGQRTSSDALSAGWTAFKARWKNVVVFALIAFGLQYAYQIVTSIVVVPLEFALAPALFFNTGTPDPAVLLPQLVRLYTVLFVVVIVLFTPMYVFYYSLWTAFFRQLTGLDVPPQPLAYGYPPMPQQPAADWAPPAPQQQPPADWAPPATPQQPPADWAPPATPTSPAEHHDAW